MAGCRPHFHVCSVQPLAVIQAGADTLHIRSDLVLKKGEKTTKDKIYILSLDILKLVYCGLWLQLRDQVVL